MSQIMSQNSVVLVKISYISVFLFLIFFEAFTRSRKGLMTSSERQEIRVNIGLGVLLGLLSFFINPLGLMLFGFISSSLNLSIYPYFWIELAFAFVVLDFLYYWNHRCNHQISLMWKAHFVHHSGQHYNLSLGPRQSVVQSIFAIPFFLPLVFLGISAKAFILASLGSLVYQFITHVHWSKDIPFIKHIFVLPRHHMVHHSSDQADYDKNFGGVFIFWDKIFGTFQEYRGSVEIGAVDESFPIDKKSFWQKLLLVFHPLPLIFRFGQRLQK